MVGASGFVVNLAVFNLIRTVTDWQTVRASVLATAIAILSNYLGLRYFAYRNRDQEDRNSRRKELTLFLFFSAIGLVIENSVLYATTYGFGWEERSPATSASSSASVWRRSSASGPTAPGSSGRPGAGGRPAACRNPSCRFPSPS